MKCVECPDYKDCRRKNDLRRKRGKCEKAKDNYVPTNADRIRAMSDEELGEFLGEWASDPKFWKCDGLGECLNWLQQPCADHFRDATKKVGGADHDQS